MKVAVVVEWADPWRGGAETSTQQFVRHLSDLGIAVDLITRSRLSPAPGIGVQTIRVRSPLRGRGSARFATLAARRVRGAYDIVHAITPCLAADVYEPRGGTVAETIERNVALRDGAARTIKRLTSRFNARQRRMLKLERRLLLARQPPVVIAISDYVARQLERHYGFPRSRIGLIFNGVEPDTAAPAQRDEHRLSVRRLYGIADDESLALLVAHNFRLKGISAWIDALPSLAADNGCALRSLVVGKDNPQRWQRRAYRRGVADRIRFVGPTRRIEAFYHAADFLVHPTYYDPCSRVVLEAMASGLPVVTTEFDGAAEAVRDGISGFVLADPRDGRLAACVRQLCRPEVRAQMSVAASEQAPGFTMRRHAERVTELYRSLRMSAAAAAS